MPEPVNIITAEKVQHWADCANLTAKRESIIHAETLSAIARQFQTKDEVITAQHKVIAELEQKLKVAEDAFQQNEQAKQELFAQRDQLLTANLNVGKKLKEARERGDDYAALVEKISKAIPKEVNEQSSHSITGRAFAINRNEVIREFKQALTGLL